MSTELATTVQEPSVALMLSQVIQSGITSENVSALEKLCDLYERMQKRNSEQQFAEAFAGLQSDMPNVKATKAVPNNDGTVRYKFAPYEDIMRQVQPLLAKHGFAVRFDNKIEETRIVSTCTLIHKGGHQQSNSFQARIGKGPPGSNESQADGSASTYAKRFALCNALNIVVEHDDDANAVGSPMDSKRIEELKGRVKQCKADEAAFLKYAGAAHWEAIPEEAYERLDAMLFRKEVEKGLRDRETGNFLF